MSEMFSRRVFLRGLGVVAAAAALTACSSTNEAVNQALIEGAVGGIVAKDCILGTSRFRSASSDVPIYYVGAKIVLTNVSSKSVTLSGDNFDTVLDGTRLIQPKFSAQDIGGSEIWRTYDNLTIRPGEERTIEVEYVTDQPTYENLWKTSHSASVAFTCGGQRVTHTFDTASRKRIVSDIETL